MGWPNLVPPILSRRVSTARDLGSNNDVPAGSHDLPLQEIILYIVDASTLKNKIIMALLEPFPPIYS